METNASMFCNIQSESINELIKALSIAQGQIGNASKDSDNPFFKSKYATLASVREACKDALSKNGLAVIQHPIVSAQATFLCTTLGHTSGQWIRSFYPIKPVKDDPQGMGSAITYARRYALAAMVGIAPEDDDGNAASGKTGVGDPGNQRTGNKAIDKWFNTLLGDMNAAQTMKELEGVFRLGWKHALESGCTGDQLVMLEQQKNNRKEFIINNGEQ